MAYRNIDPTEYFYDGYNHYFETHREVAQLLGHSHHQRLLPFVQVITQHQPLVISVEHTQGEWYLQLENGEHLQGFADHQIHLPQDLPLGYHQLYYHEHTCRIIVTPETAYQPKALVEKQKLWGASLQLYTLRSKQNWGIGDFSDLQHFLTQLAKHGGDFVGLNPIHALFPSNPENVSPYSPSSRLWLNIIYIDVNAIEAFQKSEQAQTWFKSKAIQQQLAEARTKDYIDYTQVTALKLEGLRLAFNSFKQLPQHDFERFITESGDSLTIQATYEALHQTLTEQADEQWGWNYWDTKYQDYHSTYVTEFQQTHSELIRFYMWTQFIAHQQLAACYDLTKKLDMPIGFYRDLAVGVADNGAETWADKALYALNATIGAPADMLAPQGQNWGLSPMHPHVLVERGYQPFIDLLRANMKDCGALRIDHILGLARLWWVLKGGLATEGVYIRYPLDDLLGILALESQRNQCLIIAEALGTVPDGILESLERKGIYAYNVFYFEFEGEESRPLKDYPYQAMTTLSTHDLPTVKGYWEEYDFVLGEKYDVYPTEDVLNYLKQNRKAHKVAFQKAIKGTTKKPFELKGKEVDLTFNHQLQCYVAGTNSALYATQPEDWLNMLEPVNIPGTSTEYPNWRRKLSKTTEEIFSHCAIQRLLADIDTKRK